VLEVKRAFALVENQRGEILEFLIVQPQRRADALDEGA
jgi:hypothetical protein